MRRVIGGGGGAGRRHLSGGVSLPGVVSLSCGAGGFEGVSSAPSSCGMASPLNGVDGGGDFPGRGMSAVAVTVAPSGERAILRFLLDRVSMGIAAASFAAWLCWVTPAARDDCCWGRCCGALLAAAAKVRCGVQLLLAVACFCCCCCGSWPGLFLWGCC